MCPCFEMVWHAGAPRSSSAITFHQAFEGRTIAHKKKRGGLLVSRLGKVDNLYEAHGLKCYEAKFDDGSRGRFSAAEIRNRLMPDGT